MINKHNSVSYMIGLSLLATLGSQVVEARDKSTKKHSSAADETPITYRRAERETAESSGKMRSYGLGFSTYSLPIPGTSTQALTGSFDFDRTNMVQVFFAIPGTSPGFNLGGSAFLKHTMLEGHGIGLHVGAGVGLANVNLGGAAGAHLELSFSAIGGIHFELPGLSNLVIHLDGGPTFYTQNTTPSRSSFTLMPNSSALGASVLYHF